MTKRYDFQATVNGELVEFSIPANETLLQVLRERLNLTGTKEGCGEGVCGACTVLINGKPRRACLTLALEVNGAEVLTIEGLAPPGKLAPEQEAFIEKGAIQCGFCSPGMILASHELLNREPDPTEEQIREQISGHVCRCTGYAKIVEAVGAAAAKRRQGGEA